MMSDNNNLLIDFDFSSGSHSNVSNTNPLIPSPGNLISVSPSTENSPDINLLIDCENSTKMSTNSLSIFTSSVPLYTLWNSNEAIDVDLAENNPFDEMDKQAGLLDDPFEIVSNAAMTPAVRPCPSTPAVKTGTLITIDTPEGDGHISISSDEDCDDSKSKTNSSQKNCTNPIKIEINESVQKDQTILNFSKISPISPLATDAVNKFSINNNETPTSSQSTRASGKSRTNSLNLLKYSLSNSRNDGSPGTGTDENSSSNDLLKKSQPSADESFDDLSATKPNWVDSETDIELDSDIDSDLAKLNIPMLSTDIKECNSHDNTIVNEYAKNNEKDDAKNENTMALASNREKILEKLASMKLKIPSPPSLVVTSESNETITMSGNDLIRPEEQEPCTPKNLISSVPERFRNGIEEKLMQSDTAESPNILIENLKRIVEQCDDKHKQKEAKDLLESLSSILTLENKADNQQRHELTPPQPIKRQGTFSIEKCGEDENQGEQREILQTDTAIEETVNGIRDEASIPFNQSEMMNPTLTQVIKDLRHAFGGNQNVNVVQTNNDNNNIGMPINPTFIVVMAPPSEMPLDNSPTSSYRTRRSLSLTARDKPLAALQAAQKKTAQHQAKTSTTQTPAKRPSLVRRSSFGAIPLTPSSSKTENTLQVPKTNPIRRRSLQAMPTTSTASGIRPPSPRKSPNIPSETLKVPPSVTIRRKSLNALTKDSPQKNKCSYGIIKKPAAPPVARNLKIRVKESLSGRSTAPLRANVPLNRVAPLMMINESVSPIADKQRLLPSTPRTFLAANKHIPGSPSVNTRISKGIPQACSTPSITLSTPMKQTRSDVTYLSATPNIKETLSVAASPASALNRRRSFSDYRTSSGINTNKEVKAVNSGNSGKNGLIGLKKLLPEKLRIGLQKPQPASRNKENKIPK